MATTLFGLPPSKINCCVIVTAIWKAVFFLALAHNGQPIGQIAGEHDERFISEAACQKFVDKVKSLPGDELKVDTANGPMIAETILHIVECVPSADGQET